MVRFGTAVLGREVKAVFLLSRIRIYYFAGSVFGGVSDRRASLSRRRSADLQSEILTDIRVSADLQVLDSDGHQRICGSADLRF